MRAIFITIAVILSLVFTLYAGFVYFFVSPAEGGLNYTYTRARLLLHSFSIVKELTPAETKLLYEATCTRKCHSRDVIERTPRTAKEWEDIVERMSRKASMREPVKQAVVAYLQEKFLSNVPTIISDELMRFLKRYLWRMDFGEDDLYIDIIYIPQKLRDVLPYLGVKEEVDPDKTTFLVFLNTHQSVLPPWDLAKLSVLMYKGERLEPAEWKVIYVDSKGHHKEGLLVFPSIKVEDVEGFEVVISPPGIKKRRFFWQLPVPDFEGDYEKRI